MKKKKRRIEDLITENKVKCKCGHSVFLPEIQPVKICSHCNNLVFRNDKVKFNFMAKTKRIALRRG